MKTYMPDGEIITQFRQAKHPDRQISILAQLNACSTDEMREYLISLGCEGPALNRAKPSKRGGQFKPFDEKRAMELWKEHKTDIEIGASLGVPVSRIANWRKRMNLENGRVGRKEEPVRKPKNPTPKPVKYRLTLTNEQAQVVAAACEFYARIRMGQFQEVMWKTLNMSLPVDDYCERRDKMDELLLAARAQAYPDLHGIGHSYGIGKFKDADQAFDVYQVLRTMWGDKRGAFSYYELPKCEEVKE